MPNTDLKINYYLRPQKSIERKMFCHLFRELNSIFRLKDYQYIGMGAKYFVDFMMFHREFGFSKMLSIEADSTNEDKYDFNKPLKCIEMVLGHSSEALHMINWLEYEKNIVWMDYDNQLKSYMLDDMLTIISKLKSGSMFFISYNNNLSKSERLDKFKQNLAHFCPHDIDAKNLTDLSRDAYTKQIINNVINKIISDINGPKNEEDFIFYQQLVYFKYKDGADMITFGGIILNKEDKEKFENFELTLEFVVQDINAPPYSLIIPPLTYKEMSFFLERLPCTDIDQIKLQGFNDEQLNQILKLYRYYPFFLEAAAFN